MEEGSRDRFYLLHALMHLLIVYIDTRVCHPPPAAGGQISAPLEKTSMAFWGVAIIMTKQFLFDLYFLHF